MKALDVPEIIIGLSFIAAVAWGIYNWTRPKDSPGKR